MSLKLGRRPVCDGINHNAIQKVYSQQLSLGKSPTPARKPTSKFLQVKSVHQIIYLKTANYSNQREAQM
jgi:hypothetical protein